MATQSFSHSSFCNESILRAVGNHKRSCFTAEFSRIYNKKNIECKHLSGIMAQRLYCNAQLFHDEMSDHFEEIYINDFFRDSSKPSQVFIPKSYINFMCKSDKFKTLLKYSIERIVSRMIKGLGFKCNCIAEKIIVWILICQAQEYYINNIESCWRDDDEMTYINSWNVEKKNEKLDLNFMKIYEHELKIKVDRSLNDPEHNTYKSHLISLAKDTENWDRFYPLQNKLIPENYRHIHKELNGGELHLEYLKHLFSSKLHYFVDWKNPLIRNDLLIKSLRLNKIHPSQWFQPFDEYRIYDFYYNHDDYKRVKLRNRCTVCYKRNNKKKSIKVRKCSGCKAKCLYYCSRKCQKYHWKHEHRRFCDIIKQWNR